MRVIDFERIRLKTGLCGLNKTIKFVCVAMCSLMMNLHSCDLSTNIIITDVD